MNIHSAAIAALLVAGAVQAQTVIEPPTHGYPITLSQPGSYRLGSSLIVPAGFDGIVVAPGIDVTIDFNGYAISGPAACAKDRPCYLPGGTAGVRAGSGSSVLLHGGTVRGFSQMGVGSVSSSARLQLEDMRLSGNAYGVYASRLTARRVQADDNALSGIVGREGSVAQSLAMNNGDSGIDVLAGSVVGNQAYLNASAGMHLGGGVASTRNSAMANQPNYRSAGVAAAGNSSF
ncbi:MAG: hypothetical protein ACM3N6_08180 [Betaproteobacteria bacterium]